MILKLMQKDFQASWQYSIVGISTVFVLFVVVLSAMLDDGGSIVIPVYLSIVVSACILVSMLFMMVDDVSNADELYVSLPVTRSAIVIARVH